MCVLSECLLKVCLFKECLSNGVLGGATVCVFHTHRVCDFQGVCIRSVCCTMCAR